MWKEPIFWIEPICWMLPITAGGILVLFGVERSIPSAELGILCTWMYLLPALYIPWRLFERRLPGPSVSQREKMAAVPEY
ncbi:MAG: hypothetical protein ACLQPD_35895 [Desulfomonilaceae bacterium]